MYLKLSDSVQFSSVAQSCLTLCDPMHHRPPGLPVHHHLPKFTQTHVHRVGDAIQPSHPLSSPFPPAPNPSQHLRVFANESILRMRWPNLTGQNCQIRAGIKSALRDSLPKFVSSSFFASVQDGKHSFSNMCILMKHLT